MDIPEIQYQAQQISSDVAPVQIGDPTAAMAANHAETQRQMQQHLSMLKQNAAVEMQNAKDQAFPVEELAQFSKTLSGILQQKIDQNKEDDLAEGAMLAFEEGFTPDAAFEEISKRTPRLVILDIWLGDPQMDGLAILKRLKLSHPNLPILMMSGHGTIETAVNAIRDGAYDFVEKPFKSDRLLLMIQRALEASEMARENQHLREIVSKKE